MAVNNENMIVLGDKIKKLSNGALCELVGRLCEIIKSQVGYTGYCGGIYPENIFLGIDKEPALGDASDGDWHGDELMYLPPELFWHGEKSPAGDVYSLGLVLYYAAVGHLPFESDTVDGESARQLRLSGAEITVPKSVNRRLREIIAKATAFKAADRYSTPGELKVALSSCIENTFVDAASRSSSIFNKNEEQLSDIEKMMLAIVAEGEQDAKAVFDAASQDEISLQEVSEPIYEEAVEVASAIEELETAEEVSAEADEVVESAPDNSTEAEEAVEAAAVTDSVIVSDNEEAAESEEDADMTIAEEQPKEKAEETHIPIPILVEEQNPQLQPVVPEKTGRADGVRYDRRVEQEQRIRAEVQKRRRRPVLFILVLCTLVIFAAVLFNSLNGETGFDRYSPLLTDPTPTPTIPVIVTPVPTPVPEITAAPAEEEQIPKTSVYTLYYEDVSWEQAQQRCIEMGGHLATISTKEEFDAVASLANDKGATYIWIGCRRVDGMMVWENNEIIDYYCWDINEPSMYDGDIREDYVMLWNHNGNWCYNDSRNNLLDESYAYSGKIAFICETYE